MKPAWSNLKRKYIDELEKDIKDLRSKIDHADSSGQPTSTYTLMLDTLVVTLAYLQSSDFPD